jgi:exonuclease III
VGVFCFFMKLKIISWIIRGLHEVDKCMCIRNLLRVWKADLVALQETKREQFSRSIVRSLCNGQHYYWCQLDSRGDIGFIFFICYMSVFFFFFLISKKILLKKR